MGKEGSGIRGESTEISLQLQRSFRFMPLSKEGRERGSKRGAFVFVSEVGNLLGSTSAAAAAAALPSAVLKFSEEKCLPRGIKRKEEKSSRSISEYLRCCLASLLSVTIKGIAVRNIKRERSLRACQSSLPPCLFNVKVTPTERKEI